MIKAERYDVFFADLNPSIGSEIKKKRPVVVISRNEMNGHLETVVICPLTTQIHPRWRSRIQVYIDGKEAEIAVDQIRTISRKRLIRKIDKIDKATALSLRLLISEMYGE